MSGCARSVSRQVCHSSAYARWWPSIAFWLAEVEQVLYRHPAVKELAVYGVPDELKGERVKASIVLKDGVTATSEELIAYCCERIAVYKAPESVEFVKELPKSATGKILKRVLRTQC